jgi:hypothetical protein
VEEEKKPSYAKRPLWQWLVLYALIAIVIYGLVYYLVLSKNNSYHMTTSAYPTPTKVMAKVSPTGMMKQKFSDSLNYKYAYKIFPGTLSATAQQAITGFTMTSKNLPDGSVQVALTAEKPEYKAQSYTIKTGETLYFIEMNLRDDDNEANEDHNLHDDTAVVVDPQGYIVQ